MSTINPPSYKFPNSYFFIHNLQCNGGISLPPNPTLISGKSTFIDDNAQIISSELNNRDIDALTGNNDYYFIKDDINPLEDISKNIWLQACHIDSKVKNGDGSTVINRNIHLYDPKLLKYIPNAPQPNKNYISTTVFPAIRLFKLTSDIEIIDSKYQYILVANPNYKNNKQLPSSAYFYNKLPISDSSNNNIIVHWNDPSSFISTCINIKPTISELLQDDRKIFVPNIPYINEADECEKEQYHLPNCPYWCQHDGLFKISKSNQPNYDNTNFLNGFGEPPLYNKMPNSKWNYAWKDIVLNSITDIFLNNYATQIGNNMCLYLNKISSQVPNIGELFSDNDTDNETAYNCTITPKPSLSKCIISPRPSSTSTTVYKKYK